MTTATTSERPDDPQGQFDQRYRALYTHEAEVYDRVRFDHVDGQTFNRAELAAISALLGQPLEQQSVLDIAAGTGRVAVYLATLGRRVTALDLTRNMLNKARLRAQAAEAAVALVESNGRRLPFGADRFDAVISIRFLHLLPVALHAPFVAEMWRVVKPGGVLLVEFDNALAGFGLATWGRELYRRAIRGHKSRYYVWPHQLPQILGDIPEWTLHGFWFAGGRLLRHVRAGWAEALNRFVARGWRSVLANRLFVRAVKPIMA